MGSSHENLGDTGLVIGHVVTKTIGQGIVQPDGEQVFNPRVLSAGDWNMSADMQIYRIGGG